MDDNLQTTPTSASDESNSAFDSQPKPLERIGRYRIERVLGKGGFGLVYLAHDDELNRQVAIKVPHERRADRHDDLEGYLHEARMAATLDHPGIVPVYDVGKSERFPCYVVSKYIPGTDLATRLCEGSLSFQEAAELTAAVAEALHVAHQSGLVHRDIKPANILLDKSGKPFVADFGLAIQEQDLDRGPHYIGTPAYMSPEQARGEAHRVDGRTDIFSLGVVLYELLAGKRPFKADSVRTLLDLVHNVEVRPPRQLNDRIPKELERICLKAMAKKASDRYTTARDMADDLRHWLSVAGSAIERFDRAEFTPPVQVASPEPPSVTPSDSPSLKIVPKGLRSFDAHDADFFLELLPGPRDRDGLPDSIRFWRTRIEPAFSDDVIQFCVGVIYGPSGCGKSSFVKAGLLPRLSREIAAVYIEATAGDTETRLLNVLRKRCPAAPRDCDLAETVAALRRNRGVAEGKRVLIVIDQFEQWLHGRADQEDCELVQALRHCDGEWVQCLLLVRDDFWMAATRFMRELEIRLIEGQNCAAVDRFPIRHAEKVLAGLGRALGALPEKSADATPEQRRFIEHAVAGLAEESQVVCVRLALFAEMMKNKPWTPTELEKIGGAAGVGVAFLEETFSASSAAPEHRYYQRPARAVLKELLPESGADLKGHMRSSDELSTASGLSSSPAEFERLIGILDGELRLITPTDPEGAVDVVIHGDQRSAQPTTVQERDSKGGESPGRSPAAEGIPPRADRYYQLTHDYLVAAVRDWLSRKQRETRRGRAELLLAERASQWNLKPESRFLPNLFEFLRIRLLTDRRQWTEPQRRMMAKARRRQALQSTIAVLLLAAIAAGALIGIQGRIKVDRERTAHAESLVKSLVNRRIESVGELRDSLAGYEAEARPLLETQFRMAADGSPQRLNAALALLPDEDKAEYVLSRLVATPPEQLRLVLDALLPLRRDKIVEVARAELARPAPRALSEAVRDSAAARQAVAIVALLRCGESDEVWPRLRYTADPRIRSYVIHWAPGAIDAPLMIVKRLREEPDVSVRRALILMIGQFTEAQLPLGERPPVVDWLVTAFRNDPDPGVHSAAEWLLRTWGEAEVLQPVAEKLRGNSSPTVGTGSVDGRRWYVNSQGQTYAVIEMGEFLMGSPADEPDRSRNDEQQGRVRIGRRVAVATTDVTWEQYRTFNKSVGVAPDLERQAESAGVVHADALPQTVRSWYEAARYCNWLSAQEGLPECYQPNANGSYAEGMRAKEGYLELHGYRLPTGAEWEFACRAGTTTSRFYGQSDLLLPGYAWYLPNAQNRTWPVGLKKPNDFGLFDMYGNVSQWCDDKNTRYTHSLDAVRDDSGSTEPVKDDESRVMRGGAYDCQGSILRSAGRGAWRPKFNEIFIGFRPVRTLGKLSAAPTGLAAR